ncbi:MAG: enoyl-CoA hydratase/isomerase family protein [Proteobacteria bacterium]|nr:enoyl-CoA hydratase/isomerase family protein [Pseudomonadota bacterium]
MIHYQVSGNIALITLDAAPVNALGQAMRENLLENLHKAHSDASVKAIVIGSNLALFCGGADIEEFDSDRLWASPTLHDLNDAIENGPKLTIAAINGIAMGGGLELTMACDYRLARRSAKMGLPEIKLGLFPAAGGTQRLPRLAGLQFATDMILSGTPVSADQALESGLLNRVVPDDADFDEQAINFAKDLIKRNAPRRNCSEIEVELAQAGDHFFDQARNAIARKTSGQIAPEYCLKSIELSTRLPLDEALKADVIAFRELLETPQARAMIHLFFGQREAQKIPGVTRDTKTRAIDSIGIIGAGTMGSGIAIACLDAGLPVTLLETSEEALERGLHTVAKHYDRSVEKGRISDDKAERLKTALKGTLDFAALADVDLIIEAVFEDMAIKKSVFEQLDKVCKPGAILASNTSTLDLNEMAQTTSRPGDVIGLHFFSPANIMRLLEIVRADATSADVLNSALQFAKRIGKVSAVVGVCFGFVGNRMFEPYFREGSRMLLEGATPEQIDRVLTDFGMAMGIVSVADLAGVDVSYRVRESRRGEFAQDPSYQAIQDKLYQLGRYGQKTGRGSYFYQGREKTSDPDLITLCEQLAKELGIERRDIPDQEILERCFYPLINEGIQILDDGIAYRSGDIDLIWVNGYGFPAWRGGPLWYADDLGLSKVLDGMNRYRASLGHYGELWFKPASLLERLVAENGKLSAHKG